MWKMKNDWKLEIDGLVENPISLDMQTLKSLPQVTKQVTLECAGNGRALVKPPLAEHAMDL